MNDNKYSSKDALGNEIIIGENYGYSSNNGGISLVKIGTASKMTNKGLVTLKVLIHKTAYWANDLKDPDYEPSKTISVKPQLLFPVDIFKINYGK